jgi:hypothetical protein
MPWDQVKMDHLKATLVLYSQHEKTGQICPVFEWTILPRTGHLKSGQFKNWTNLSGFQMVTSLDRFTIITFINKTV